MDRFTNKELEDMTAVNFIQYLISERRKTLTNPYSPMNERLSDLSVWVEHNMSHAQKIPSRHTVEPREENER